MGTIFFFFSFKVSPELREGKQSQLSTRERNKIVDHTDDTGIQSASVGFRPLPTASSTDQVSSELRLRYEREEGEQT